MKQKRRQWLARGVEALRKGGTISAKEMREAVEGKATQRVEMMSQSERRIEIAVRYVESEIGNPRALETQVIDIVPETPAIEASEEEFGLDAPADGEFCPWPPKKAEQK